MKVVELKDLVREDGQIFYIRHYTCVAVFELPKSVESAKVQFSIEMNCLGNKTIDVEMENTVNYPLLPLKTTLTNYILELEKESKLPC